MLIKGWAKSEFLYCEFLKWVDEKINQLVDCEIAQGTTKFKDDIEEIFKRYDVLDYIYDEIILVHDKENAIYGVTTKRSQFVVKSNATTRNTEDYYKSKYSKNLIWTMMTVKRFGKITESDMERFRRLFLIDRDFEFDPIKLDYYMLHSGTIRYI